MSADFPTTNRHRSYKENMRTIALLAAIGAASAFAPAGVLPSRFLPAPPVLSTPGVPDPFLKLCLHPAVYAPLQKHARTDEPRDLGLGSNREESTNMNVHLFWVDTRRSVSHVLPSICLCSACVDRGLNSTLSKQPARRADF